PLHPDTGQSWLTQWGKQVDVRVVRTGLSGSDAITETHVAGYLAKYATKSTEVTGVTLRRLTAATVDYFADPDGNHVARLVDAAWSLGRPDPLPTDSGDTVPGPFEGLRRGAHQYGFAGHFSTKSQKYSTTLGRLRAARRIAAVRGVNPAVATPLELSDEAGEQATVTLAEWTYQGTGWLTLADAALAMQAAAAARERRPANLTTQP
ncbi:MAG: replication initiator, partial [Candidatus Dormibacteraceae bacterium]